MMQFKSPKDDSKYQWTNHVKQKMLYYGISESLIKRTTRAPKRIETGVAPDTIAVMQPRGTKQKPQEIWVMYQLVGSNQFTVYSDFKKRKLKTKNWQLKTNKKRIISAWRYPGISKPGKKIPIPDEILAELEIQNYEED